LADRPEYVFDALESTRDRQVVASEIGRAETVRRTLTG